MKIAAIKSKGLINFLNYSKLSMENYKENLK